MWRSLLSFMRCMSQQLAPGIAGEAAIRPLAGQRRFSVRQCTDANGGVADSLDEAKAAFRAAGIGKEISRLSVGLFP